MYDTTITGSFYRTKERKDLFNKMSATCEAGEGHETEINTAERLPI